MKTSRLLLIGAVSVTLAAVVFGPMAVAGSSKSSKSIRKGTSIYHKYLVAQMSVVDPDEDPGRRAPHGRVMLKHNKQGAANNQRLEITMDRLDPNATYMLLAVIGDDTDYMHVADFDTSRSGSAHLKFRHIGSSRGRGNGHAKHALPEILSPISNLKEIAVANVSTQLVLRADLTVPSSLHYLIKRNMDNDGVDGDAQAAVYIKANNRKSSFRLYASGLDEAGAYRLELNEDPEWSEEATATDRGHLVIKSWPVEHAEVLFVEHIALWNSESNSVLSTTLQP